MASTAMLRVTSALTSGTEVAARADLRAETAKYLPVLTGSALTQVTQRWTMPGIACTSTAPESAIASLPRIVRSLMK